MTLRYSKQAVAQLHDIEAYIAQDSKVVAVRFLEKIKNKLELLIDFPYMGKVNATANRDDIRELVTFGYKTIYKINEQSITILAIYKYINFDESSIYND